MESGPPSDREVMRKKNGNRMKFKGSAEAKVTEF